VYVVVAAFVLLIMVMVVVFSLTMAAMERVKMRVVLVVKRRHW